MVNRRQLFIGISGLLAAAAKLLATPKTVMITDSWPIEVGEEYSSQTLKRGGMYDRAEFEYNSIPAKGLELDSPRLSTWEPTGVFMISYKDHRFYFDTLGPDRYRCWGVESPDHRLEGSE